MVLMCVFVASHCNSGTCLARLRIYTKKVQNRAHYFEIIPFKGIFSKNITPRQTALAKAKQSLYRSGVAQKIPGS